jgi:hypothetical protein
MREICSSLLQSKTKLLSLIGQNATIGDNISCSPPSRDLLLQVTAVLPERCLTTKLR